MVIAFSLLPLAAAQAVSAASLPVAGDFEVTCALVGRDAARARFVLVAAGAEGDRRFAIRPDDASRWVDRISAGSAREGNNFHFVSGSTAYRLTLKFDERDGNSLSAAAELNEDRGIRALDRQVAAGSCSGSRRVARSALPAHAPAPKVGPETYQVRPVGLNQGNMPSNCTIVLRDLREVRFMLDATFDMEGIHLAAAPIQGEAWPVSAFTVRGARLAAITTSASGPPGGFMMVFASAGTSPSGGSPGQFEYQIRAEPGLIEGWIDVRALLADSDLMGAGHCAVRQSDDGAQDR